MKYSKTLKIVIILIKNTRPFMSPGSPLFSSLSLPFQGNALYNVIPDIISHLSDPTDSKVSPDTFRNIMK